MRATERPRENDPAIVGNYPEHSARWRALSGQFREEQSRAASFHYRNSLREARVACVARTDLSQLRVSGPIVVGERGNYKIVIVNQTLHLIDATNMLNS